MILQIADKNVQDIMSLLILKILVFTSLTLYNIALA